MLCVKTTKIHGHNMICRFVQLFLDGLRTWNQTERETTDTFIPSGQLEFTDWRVCRFYKDTVVSPLNQSHNPIQPCRRPG